MSVRSLQLVWDEHLQSIGNLFQKLYEDELLVDVTLSCRDGNLRGHKIVLSACSPYFQNVFRENPCKHPTIIMRGVSYQEMSKLLEYMYRGVIDVSVDRVNSLIQLALDLDIKGFEKFTLDNTSNCVQEQNKCDVDQVVRKFNLTHVIMLYKFKFSSWREPDIPSIRDIKDKNELL